MVNAPGAAPGALRGLRLRDGRAVDRADGPRADDGRGPAIPRPARSARRSTCRSRPRSRTIENDLLRRAGSWASRRSRSTATTARWASRCPTPKAKKEDADAKAEPEKVVEYRPIRKRLPKKRPSETVSFSVGGCQGLPDRLVLPGRRARRGLPQDVQAGLDPRRRDGRVLRRHLDRSAVRRAAGDVRRRSSPTCGSSRPA